MPKNPNYAHCVFYRLVCRDVSVTECYVGHTCDEVKRRGYHKTKCHNEKTKHYNYFVYKFIREHGGWDNWQLLVHEKLAVEDKIAARLRERYWTEHYNATLNSQVPGRTKSEYYLAHVDEKKAYREEKHTCSCGGKFTTNGRSQHLKTKKHLGALN
jgi:hypothetical protein